MNISAAVCKQAPQRVRRIVIGTNRDIASRLISEAHSPEASSRKSNQTDPCCSTLKKLGHESPSRSPLKELPATIPEVTSFNSVRSRSRADQIAADYKRRQTLLYSMSHEHAVQVVQITHS